MGLSVIFDLVLKALLSFFRFVRGSRHISLACPRLTDAVHVMGSRFTFLQTRRCCRVSRGVLQHGGDEGEPCS